MASRSAFDVNELRGLYSHDQVYWLIQWFESTFFDPEEEAHKRIKRNYRWPPSGPIDPLEELVFAFGQYVSRSTLEETAKELTERSTNWHSRPDEAPLSEKPREGRPFRVGDRAGMPLWINPEEYREDLLQKIDILAAAVANLQTPQAGFSHNGPPGPLDDGPVTRSDIAELSANVAALREEAESPAPMPATLASRADKLLAFGQKVAGWCGQRATKFVDAALTAAGSAAGAAFALSLAGLLPNLHEVVAAVSRFIEAIGH